MIVHHTRSLHMSVANGGAEKLKAAFFHVLTYRIRDGRACRYFIRMIDDRFPFRHKAVQVFIK